MRSSREGSINNVIQWMLTGGESRAVCHRHQLLQLTNQLIKAALLGEIT